MANTCLVWTSSSAAVAAPPGARLGVGGDHLQRVAVLLHSSLGVLDVHAGLGAGSPVGERGASNTSQVADVPQQDRTLARSARPSGRGAWELCRWPPRRPVRPSRRPRLRARATTKTTPQCRLLFITEPSCSSPRVCPARWATRETSGFAYGYMASAKLDTASRTTVGGARVGRDRPGCRATARGDPVEATAVGAWSENYRAYGPGVVSRPPLSQPSAGCNAGETTGTPRRAPGSQLS